MTIFSESRQHHRLNYPALGLSLEHQSFDQILLSEDRNVQNIPLKTSQAIKEWRSQLREIIDPLFTMIGSGTNNNGVLIRAMLSY